MSDQTGVVHVPDQNRFELRDGADADAEVSVLTYERSEGEVRFLHTVVPPELEGRGVGSRLAERAVAWAREEGLEVVPVCSFVQSWLQRHPEALQG